MYLEKEFQILECELDIMSMELDYSMKMTNFLTEKTDNDKSIFDKVVEYIKKSFKKLHDFLNDHFFSKKEKELKEMISKNKKLSNFKCKIKDYTKIYKLDKDYMNKLSKIKSKEDAEKLMNKYKRERDHLLISLPIITISLGGIIKLLNDKKKQYYQYHVKESDLLFDIEEYSRSVDYFLHELKFYFANFVKHNREDDKNLLMLLNKAMKQNTIVIKKSQEKIKHSNSKEFIYC